MTSHAPTPGRPTPTVHRRAARRGRASRHRRRVAATGPKLPPFVGDGTPASEPDVLASIAELLTAGPLPNTVTAALMITDPKIPTYVGD